MNSNADQFARDLMNEFEVAVPGAFVDLHGAITMRVLKSCIDLTAVDTGRLRNNWQATVNAPGAEQFGPGPSREAGQLSSAEAALEQMEPFGVTYVSNPIEYASFLENGTPRMAAQPMVRPTIAAVETWAQAQGAQ